MVTGLADIALGAFFGPLFIFFIWQCYIWATLSITLKLWLLVSTQNTHKNSMFVWGLLFCWVNVANIAVDWKSKGSLDCYHNCTEKCGQFSRLHSNKYRMEQFTKLVVKIQSENEMDPVAWEKANIPPLSSTPPPLFLFFAYYYNIK